MIESGPLCITDLFQNKSVAYFQLVITFYKLSYNFVSFVFCNFLVWVLKYFLKNEKKSGKNHPKKFHTYGSWEFFSLSAALTAPNSPELHFRYINYFIQPSLLESLFISTPLGVHFCLPVLLCLNHKSDALQIICTTFPNPLFLQKCRIFRYFSIFHKRVAAESQKLYKLILDPRSSTKLWVRRCCF